MQKDKELMLLKRYIDFFTDLNVKKVMNTSVISLTKEDTYKRAQQIMKDEKISGIPIVTPENKLVNIITMEDIIKVLEKQEIETKILNSPDKEVLTLNEKDSFEKIIEYISTYDYGRYPVVDSENNLVGLITKKDILFTVVRKLSALYLHDERRREILNSPLSILIKDKIQNKNTEFKYDINNNDVNDAGEGSALLKEYLKKKEFDDKLIRKISIATYEAEVNVVIHGGGIGKILVKIDRDSIMVIIEDIGPGIENIDKAMETGFSTAPEYIRSLGFGAGMGLANINRFADKLLITSEKGNGTKLEMLFWM
ncbi:MAG: CBS domain-containing protein [Fusobacteriota bacterium]